MSVHNLPNTPWLKILKVAAGSWLGLVDGVLYVGDARKPKRRLDLLIPTGLLPCLERPHDVVLGELREKEKELALAPGELSKIVPLESIPTAAVATEMDYWAALSLGWIKAMPLDDRQLDLLLALENAPWASQRTRHRARSVRKSMA